MFKETKPLIEKRATLIEENRTLINTAEAREEEKQDFTSEEETEYDQRDTEIVSLTKRIKRITDQNILDSEAAERLAEEAEDTGEDTQELTEKKKAYKEVFWKMIRLGERSLTSEESGILMQGDKRAQETTTGASGGFTVAEDFMRELDRALLEFGGMREVSRIIRSSTGANLPWPTVNDTAVKGELLVEGDTAAEEDAVFGSVIFESFMYSSKLIPVSMQLLQDSEFDFPTLLRDLFVERVGRITNEHFTVGTGTGQPRGVVTAAPTINAAANNAITADEIIDLQHAVDPAYRKAKSNWFMFNDNTLKSIRKLKDLDGQFLWQPGLRAEQPDLLLGKPYIINQDVPDIGALNVSMLSGDFSKYIIRDVQNFEFFRLDEVLRTKAQVGFIGFQRTDGDLIDAGTGPIKGLKHPA